MKSEAPKTASDILKEFEEVRAEEQKKIDKAFNELRDAFYKAFGLDKIVKYMQRKLSEGGKE